MFKDLIGKLYVVLHPKVSDNLRLLAAGRLSYKALDEPTLRYCYLCGFFKPNKYNNYDGWNDYAFLLRVSMKSKVTNKQNIKAELLMRNLRSELRSEEIRKLSTVKGG